MMACRPCCESAGVGREPAVRKTTAQAMASARPLGQTIARKNRYQVYLAMYCGAALLRGDALGQDRSARRYRTLSTACTAASGEALMSSSVSPGLPGFERSLLSTVGRLVPSQEREEWLRTWQAELWYIRHRSRDRHVSPLTGILDLSIGLTRDALWLRTETWRVAFSDTAMLCAASLRLGPILSVERVRSRAVERVDGQ
jgi:hypothetical protein